MDLEVETCVRCGHSLRDLDPLENNQPVAVGGGKEICSRCFNEMMEAKENDN